MDCRYSPFLYVLVTSSLWRLMISRLIYFHCTVQYLPSWLPGMGFKRIANEWKSTIFDFNNLPYAFVKNQMVRAQIVGSYVFWYSILFRSSKAAGKDKLSFTSYNIEKGLADSESDEETLKQASAQLFGAGADTVSILLILLHTMIWLNC